MKRVQWPQLNRMVVALLFAVIISTVSLNQQLMAEPLKSDAWEKISTSDLETAMGSYGTINSIVEYEGEIYAGGMADPEGTLEYEAVVYSLAADGSWELVSPDLGASEDSQVTHMVVFEGKLYIAVDAWVNGPLRLWTYDSTADTWLNDDSFTLNDSRIDDYITQVIGMGSVGEDNLCATTIDLNEPTDLAVMCTDGTSDWRQLPSIDFPGANLTSNHRTNLLAMPTLNTVAIVLDYDSGGGVIKSAMIGYDDVEDLDGEWVAPPMSNVGEDRTIAGPMMFITDGGMGGIFTIVSDALGGTNAEIWEIASIGMSVPLGEPLRSAHFLETRMDADGSLLLVSGTNDSNMAVIKSFDSGVWVDVGPSADQVGSSGSNPAEYVTFLKMQDNGDIFLALQGNDSLDGNSTLWYYDASNDEGNVPGDGDANGDGIDDDEQDNVSSFVNPVTGKYISVELEDHCAITAASASAESTAVRDVGYDYAAGLVDFSANCNDSSTEVVIYHYDTSADDVVLRKHNSHTNAYFNVSGATVSSQTVNGQQVAVARYTIVDNGELDLDPVLGQITDPVGLANLVVGVPNTGLGGLTPVLPKL